MTNLEQLARIINQHQLKGVGGGTMLVSWAICTCDHAVRTHGDRDYAQQLLAHHQAQAIHDAGWQAPVTGIDIKQRVDEILANDDTELRHCDEDALYEELALARLTPEERVHIQRLQDADLDRWYA